MSEFQTAPTDEPAFHKTGERTEAWTWHVAQTEGDFESDHGIRCVRLSVSHDKRRKMFIAHILTHTEQPCDGYSIEKHVLGFGDPSAGDVRIEVAGESIGRFSQKRFDAFAAQARADFPTWAVSQDVFDRVIADA